MGGLARLVGLEAAAVKSPGVPSISSDGTYITAPISWWGQLVGSTGLAVNEERALALPTLYACVRVLAETIASVPFPIYKRNPDGGKERDTGHPLYRVFHDQPNEAMSSFVWRETLMTHEGTWGNSFSEVKTDGLGDVTIWPIAPWRMTVGWEGGRKVYDYLTDDGKQKRMAPDTVLHIPGLSLNGLVGLSPVQAHRHTLGESVATRTFGESFWRNSARPGFILSHPKTLTDPAVQRLKAQMDELRGSGNSGKTLVLEEGLTPTPIGVPPEDAQYIETRKLQREDIASIYRMPPHMVGILDHATFSNIEHQSIDFVVHTIRPWMVRIEQAINNFFFPDGEHFAEFLVDGLLRGDAQARAAALKIQHEEGVLTDSEWREIENRNPFKTDRRWSPAANYTADPIDEEGEPLEPPADQQPPDLTLLQGGAPQAQQGPATPPAPSGGTPPQLAVVKAASVRCPGCSRLLAEQAAPPYRIACRHCKAVAVGEVPGDPKGEAALAAVKYSDDQPRDDQGRWTSGGGGGAGGASADTAAHAAPAEEGTASSRALAAGVRARAEAEEPRISATLNEVVDGRHVSFDEAMQAIPAAPGGDLAGFEARLKGEGSLARKIASDAEAKGISEAQAAADIGDSVRYTVRYNEDEFEAGATRTYNDMVARGYTPTKWAPNFAEGAAYKGMNTNWISPSGTKIEVQFHTPRSFMVKERNHVEYEQQRRLPVGSPEYVRLSDTMAARAASVAAPSGWSNLTALFRP